MKAYATHRASQVWNKYKDFEMMENVQSFNSKTKPKKLKCFKTPIRRKNRINKTNAYEEYKFSNFLKTLYNEK